VSEHELGLPIEEFINALSSQLDRVQTALALKARNGVALTFAVKDISLDLRAHVDMLKSVVYIRPAGPGETDASILRLSLTTITRPMIEENTRQLEAEVAGDSLEDALGDSLDEEARRRLEWAGIHSVTQLRDMQRDSGERTIERAVNLPVMRLRRALEQAALPRMRSAAPERQADRTLLRIRGANLTGQDTPAVRIGGRTAEVLEASEGELLVSTEEHPLAGALEVETGPGAVATADLTDLISVGAGRP
jgi:hypothetical protein